MLRSVRSRMQDYPALVRKSLWLLVALVFAATTTAMEVRAQELIARRVLKLGVPSGSPAQEFHRIADVDLIGDSIVAVASTGTHDVRLFDSRGRFLRSWGRQGGGPGEFQFIFSPGGMYVVRDSIWIFDSALQRVTVFSTAGEYGRAIPLSQFGVGRVFLSGIFADGSAPVVSPRCRWNREYGQTAVWVPSTFCRWWHPRRSRTGCFGGRVCRTLPP
jgi:hypothetical protein